MPGAPHAVDSRRSWLVAAAAALSMFTVFGVAYSFGAFFESITEDFETGSGATATVFGITICLSFLLGPFTGGLSDRVGPAIVLRIGAASLAAGLLLTTVVSHITLAYLVYGLGVGTAVACGYVPMVAVVGGWFERQRTLALGAAVAGIGLGTLVGSPLAAWLIQISSWRSAFVIFGVGGAAIMLGLSFVVTPGPAHVASAARQSIRELWSLPSFATLYVSMMVVSFGLFVPVVFVAAYAKDRGTSDLNAALLVGLIGGASVIGRLSFGALAGRMDATRLFQTAFLVMASSQALWYFAGATYPMLVVYSVIFGAGYGGFIALSPAVAADRFGLQGLGGLLGTWYTAAAFGALLGPPTAGVIVDSFGYRFAIVFAAVTIGTGWVMLTRLES